MKPKKIIAAALAVTLGTTAAFASDADVIRVDAPSGDKGSEIGYPKYGLGYEAMVARDYAAAIAQIEQSNVAQDDPARLINLGQAYAKIGRPSEGRKLVLAALNGRKHFDLVLANGEVVNSRTVAEMALRKMERQLTAR